MPKLRFVKMEGAGNDYVFVDSFLSDVPPGSVPDLARQLSDRHFGIGADGLILLAPSDRADCRMMMWNADGSRAEMCGNGIRCLAKLAFDLGHVEQSTLQVESDSGIREVELVQDEDGEIAAARVAMDPVSVEATPASVTVAGTEWQYHVGDAGNPHAVVFTDVDPDRLAIDAVGAAFQELDEFPEGVNVEFVHVQTDASLRQRTYERGSGETLACGTGATVAALAAMRTSRVPGPSVPVHLKGGTLTVVQRRFSLVMEGPVRTVFTGEVSVANNLHAP